MFVESLEDKDQGERKRRREILLEEMNQLLEMIIVHVGGRLRACRRWCQRMGCFFFDAFDGLSVVEGGEIDAMFRVSHGRMSSDSTRIHSARNVIGHEKQRANLKRKTNKRSKRDKGKEGRAMECSRHQAFDGDRALRSVCPDEIGTRRKRGFQLAFVVEHTCLLQS